MFSSYALQVQVYCTFCFATPIGGKVGITHSAGIEPAPPVYRTSMLPLHHEHCTVCGQT